MHETYAQALWKLVQKGQKPKDAVEQIYTQLEVRGRTALMPAIGRALKRLAQREAEKNQSILIVSQAKDERLARKESGSKEAELKIDESLIGGWQLLSRGTFVDASWKSKLLSIYNAATRS